MTSHTIAAFRIPGKPQAWQRAGVVRKRGQIIHFTPASTRDFKKVVAILARAAMRGAKPVTCAISLDITFAMPIPKSWTKRQREVAERGEMPHLSKPDLDNLAKGVKDALTGIVWIDDCQVVTLHLRKLYSADPATHVVVRNTTVP